MDARGTEMQRDAVSRRHEPNPSGLRATKVTKEGVDAISCYFHDSIGDIH